VLRLLVPVLLRCDADSVDGKARLDARLGVARGATSCVLLPA
jgi:hypothetical protein